MSGRRVPEEDDAVVLRRLAADEGVALTSAVVAAYGFTYDLRWAHRRADDEVMRTQSLHGKRISTEDVVVASDHGRELLDYVLADLPRGSIT